MATCADTVPYCVRYGVLKEHVERVTCGGECHDEPTMFCLTAVPVTDLRAHHGPILGALSTAGVETNPESKAASA